MLTSRQEQHIMFLVAPLFEMLGQERAIRYLTSNPSKSLEELPSYADKAQSRMRPFQDRRDVPEDLIAQSFWPARNDLEEERERFALIYEYREKHVRVDDEGHP